MPPTAPIMMEVYALREIEKDEEVVIDYTHHWEEAYLKHVETTQQSATLATQQSPQKQRRKRVNITQFSTIDEVLISRNLPAGRYECRLEPLSREDLIGILTEEDYRARDHQFPKNYLPHVRTHLGNNQFAMWFPCDVLERLGNGLRVQVFSRSLQNRKVIRKYFNLPLEALRLVEAPYQSDQHKLDAFRHFIPIPDKLFPARWRSNYNSSKDFRLGVVSEGIDAAAPENQNLLDKHERRLREVKCGLYFAPSNIPEAGFSSYSAVAYEGKSIVIGSTLPAVILPGVFTQGMEEWDMKDYIWTGRSYNAEYEVDANYTSEAMGASLANFHPGILNMGLKRPEFQPLLDRCVDPGAGGSSDYLGCAFQSKLEMQPGEEMFISYGDSWFLNRPEFHDVAVSYNYEESNTLLASVWGLMQADGLSLKRNEVEGMLSLFRKRFIKDKRTLSALSRVSRIEDIERVVTRNGTAQAEMKLRSLEWLEENGQCMDHIYVALSSLSQAGQGAFSRRFLKQGQTVLSSPMVHTWGRKYFEIDRSNITEDINPLMQMLNYQFTHADSLVHFLPINQVIAINHNSKRMPNGQQPNVEIRWASWDKRSSYYLERPLEDLKNEHHSTMIIDVVATRDIQVDEEIFIDYGMEWENAWLEHVKNWESPCTTDKNNFQGSKRISEMNNAKYRREYWAWTKEHFTVCWDEVNLLVSTVYIVEEGNKESDELSSRFNTTSDYHGIRIEHEGFALTKSDTGRVPCIITNVRNNMTFDVIRFPNWDIRREVKNAEMLQVYEGLPQNLVMFLPKPWRSDLYWKGAFRHPIAIPDHVFPRHWRQ